MDNLNKQMQLSTFFDYDSLDQAHRCAVQAHTDEIRKRLRRSAQDVWEIGQRLADVRSRLKYGQFLAWLKAEFGWSQRTAYNFINVYETFGDRFANLAKVDIATSVLYQLAAPSVPEELRTRVLEAAESGEKITYKSIKSAILRSKAPAKKTPKIVQPVDSSNSTVKRPEIITVISKPAHVVEAADPKSTSKIVVKPGWYRLGEQHWLFCGDTADHRFFKPIPQAKLAIAVTTEDWAHDWLVDQADSVVILPEEDMSIAKFQELLTLLSQPGDTVVLPWLPFPQMVAAAHRLNRIVYAGDSNIERCQHAIATADLPFEALVNEPAITLVS
ncbi:MAG: DUF3102 domain-containing protein [Cyanobacteria bacterium P01_C01_bin.120]